MQSVIKNRAPRRILLLAEYRRGHGSGHLRRCAELADELDGEIEWLLPRATGGDYLSREEALSRAGDVPERVTFIEEPTGAYDALVVDQRELSLEELSMLRSHARCAIGLDLAGSARPSMDYLIDMLGLLPDTHPPNVADRGLLPLPNHTRDQWPTEVRSILVALGSADSDRRAASLAHEIASAYPSLTVTAVLGEAVSVPEQVKRLPRAPGLAERLADSDLVITHYGRTAWEAIWARVPVLLVHPSRYHRRLTRAVGLPELGAVSRLGRLLAKPQSFIEACVLLRPAQRSSLAELINGLEIPETQEKPRIRDGATVSVGSGGSDRAIPAHSVAIARYPGRTFVAAPGHGTVYQRRFAPLQIAYDESYFFEEYARQYGRTYLADFDHIKAMGARRLRDIRRVRNRIASQSGHPARGVERLLDIGCAYGPFLAAAADEGYQPVGLDVSPGAVEWVRTHLGYEAHHLDIRTTESVAGAPFDVVTMWYVIEHFPDVDEILARVAALVRPGGLFALATPNGDGISARRSRERFLAESPQDHYTIWTPRSARRLLLDHGFAVRSVRITGHHPERFALGTSLRTSPPSLFRTLWERLLRRWSEFRGLGDTFEVIAERIV